MSTSSVRLTTPDFVLLGLFTEKDWYGYELNAELERRQVVDWAGISRPQIYYSLRKLSEQSMIAPLESTADKSGPERQVYRITEAGKVTFAEGLEREEWVTQHVPTPFLTWFALSPYASRPAAERMIAMRSGFLQKEIDRENQHLEVIGDYAGVVGQVAYLMVTHKISQYESEIAWLTRVKNVLFDSQDTE